AYTPAVPLPPLIVPDSTPPAPPEIETCDVPPSTAINPPVPPVLSAPESAPAPPPPDRPMSMVLMFSPIAGKLPTDVPLAFPPAPPSMFKLMTLLINMGDNDPGQYTPMSPPTAVVVVPPAPPDALTTEVILPREVCP